MARFWTSPFEEFDHVFDQLFDELLIGRWRTATRSGGEHAIVTDYGNRYEVQISTAVLSPHQQVGLEVDDNHLTVSGATAVGGKAEHSFSFKDPIERNAVTARWFDSVLFISLPKRRKRSVAARKSTET